MDEKTSEQYEEEHDSDSELTNEFQTDSESQTDSEVGEEDARADFLYAASEYENFLVEQQGKKMQAGLALGERLQDQTKQQLISKIEFEL